MKELELNNIENNGADAGLDVENNDTNEKKQNTEEVNSVPNLIITDNINDIENELENINQKVNNYNNKLNNKNNSNCSFTRDNILQLRYYFYELTYILIILQFYTQHLKETMSCATWSIIVISSLMSFINLFVLHEIIDDDDFNKYFNWAKTILLAIFSVIITLISAYIKKENFVQRIQDLDKRVFDMTNTQSELEFIIIKPDEYKGNYLDFLNKYSKSITIYKNTTSLITPRHWNFMLYIVTKYYPDLIFEKIPWYSRDQESGKWTRNDEKCIDIIENYQKANPKNCLYKLFCSNNFNPYKKH
jgi:hypothetical protein